jgi:hypothetical protein
MWRIALRSATLRTPRAAGMARGEARVAAAASHRHFSTAPAADGDGEAVDIFNPSGEHRALREMVSSFVANEVEPQALEYNREEKFNHALFRRCGELGLLGVTVDPEYGGAGMDAAAACIVHEELAYSDPAFCLSYLAHSQLFVNNLARNGTHDQKARLLPSACDGSLIGGMCMSEPAAGTDVLGMGTKAVEQADGSFLITGQKMWITNGAVSDTELGDAFLVYAVRGHAPLPPHRHTVTPSHRRTVTSSHRHTAMLLGCALSAATLGCRRGGLPWAPRSGPTPHLARLTLPRPSRPPHPAASVAPCPSRVRSAPAVPR